jgi:hypothetical protein
MCDFAGLRQGGLISTTEARFQSARGTGQFLYITLAFYNGITDVWYFLHYDFFTIFGHRIRISDSFEASLRKRKRDAEGNHDTVQGLRKPPQRRT